MSVPYTFATATSSIPLSQLDSNFATAITLGGTNLYLGNTTTTVTGLTLTGSTFTGNVTTSNAVITGGSIDGTTVGATTASTGAFTTLTSSSTATLNTLHLTNVLGTAYGGTGLTSFTANGVVYASSTSALTTGSALTFDGTNLTLGGNLITGSTVTIANSATTISLGNNNASSTSQTINIGSGALTSGYTRTINIGNNTGLSGIQTIYIGNTNLGGQNSPITIAGDLTLGGGTLANLTTTYCPNGLQLRSVQSGGWRAGVTFYDINTSSTIGWTGFMTNGSQMDIWAYKNVPLLFGTNNSEVGRFDTSGNLGIGTSSPASYNGYKTLTMNGSTGGLIQLQSNGTNTGRFYSPTSTTSTIDTVVGDLKVYASGNVFIGGNNSTAATFDTSGNLGLGVTPSAWGAGNTALQLPNYGIICFNNSGGSITGNAYYNGGWKYQSTNYATKYDQQQNAGQHQWYTAPSGTAGNAISFTQAMTLNNSGQLLVGTTTSYGGTVSLLPVGGNPTSTTSSLNQLSIGEASANTGYSLKVGYTFIGGGYGGSIQSIAGGAVAPLYLNGSGGNVGIGTTSPATALDVVGVETFRGAAAAGAILTITPDASSGANGVAYNTTFATGGNGPHIWQVGGSEKARIDSSGNLLVGTTGNSAYGVIVGSATTGTNKRVAAFFSNTTGDVGYGALLLSKFDNNTTTSQVFAQFAVNNNGSTCGQINGNGANQAAFGTWSDARLKENIVDLPSQLSNIMALRPVEFDYIESEGGGHQIGFIAQEMETVYSDAVGERADGMKTVSGWSKTEARLVKAIQELKAEFDAYKASHP